ncbi:Cyclin, N-terminal domain [Nesidiocoris tenuis]|uniref:Cyclin, N-terminal domain n=1 Tax=Nesidiocoris tenuis TaxID=355587 RepID=A0ABN7ARP3_9HEMI|nr:Cyclin, N-terminal domain [Nesidiocoris tenuis]
MVTTSTSMAALQESLSLEPKYIPVLRLLQASQDAQEVTVGVRDGTAHVLRCLKVWFDLPSDVLCIAVNVMDRFLTSMKVKARHMACISVAAFQIACRYIMTNRVPDSADILAISQSNCTPGDLSRMEQVITSKLGISYNSSPVTVAIFLRIFHDLLKEGGNELYSSVMHEAEIWTLTEVISCDAGCSNFRPSEVALVLLCSLFDSGIASLNPPPPASTVLSIVAYFAHLQKLCQIPELKFYECHSAVLTALNWYHARTTLPNKQRLVWKLSNRTLKKLRPTERHVFTLPTIDEHGQLQLPTKMFRSYGSTSSEEGWSSE